MSGKTEYKIHYVVHHGGMYVGGQSELDSLIKQGWQIIDEQDVDEWVTNDGVHCYKTKYRLQRNTY